MAAKTRTKAWLAPLALFLLAFWASAGDAGYHDGLGDHASRVTDGEGLDDTLFLPAGAVVDGADIGDGLSVTMVSESCAVILQPRQRVHGDEPPSPPI